ncbi:MAG: DUF2390 domain-containing protein [Pseudomonadota bacterium]
MRTVPEQLPTTLEPDNPLWRFALAFWEIPGVEPACLDLQRKRWSVTRILSACWLTISGHIYTGNEDNTVTEWRTHVTESLRSARQYIPRNHPGTNSLRTTIARGELEAERIELALVYRSLAETQKENAGMHGSEQLARINLEAAAPETAMDLETGNTVDALARSLTAFRSGNREA